MFDVVQGLKDVLNRLKNEVDYVIESGSVTIGDCPWKWEKWKSGKAVCWCIKQVGATNNGGSVSGFYYRIVSYKYPTGLFVEAPTCVVNAKWGTGTSWGNMRDIGAEDFSAIYFSNQEIGALCFHMYATGRWK